MELFRGWDQKEVGYLQMLRYIRISSIDPEKVSVSRPGQHPRLISVTDASQSRDTEMVDVTG